MWRGGAADLVDDFVASIARFFRRQTGVTCAPATLLTTIRHGVTRYRITLDCYAADFASGRLHSANGSPLRWIAAANLADLPLSTTGRKLSRLVCQAG